MRYALNILYLLLIFLALPSLLWRRWRQGKYRAGWSQKLWGELPARHGDRPCLWLHAVSVGEVLQLEPIIASWQKTHPEWEIALTTTTSTGMEVAQKKYPDCLLSYCPLDFTWAVKKAFDRLRPTCFVLVELELWPNLILEAHRRQIPAALINGRLSERSFRGYRKLRRLIQPLLAPFRLIAVQNEEYAERFDFLGAKSERLLVAGSIKFDRLETDREHAAVMQLRRDLGIPPKQIVLMAGSTHAPEEEILLNVWESLRGLFPELTLIIAPRHAERFQQVAELIERLGHPVVRRTEQRPVAAQEHLSDHFSEESGHKNPKISEKTPSAKTAETRQPVLLLDTLGELSTCWGLADLAYVGGSLTNRGGQNMMEPAAYGAVVLFGPNTWNFAEVVEELKKQQACVEVSGEKQLQSELKRLLKDPATRQKMGQLAQEYVLSQQGATEKTVRALEQIVGRGPRGKSTWAA